MKIFSAIFKNSKNFKLLCYVLKDLCIDITMVITHNSIIISSIDKNILLSICLPSSSINNSISFFCILLTILYNCINIDLDSLL